MYASKNSTAILFFLFLDNEQRYQTLLDYLKNMDLSYHVYHCLQLYIPHRCFHTLNI